MPIRMTPDEDQRANDNYPGGGGGGNRGGGGGLFNFLPIILSLFGRNPKMMIVLLLIAGGLYFFKGGCNMGSMQQLSSLAMGANFDQQKYDKAEVFEPLAYNDKNPLPESVSLLKYCPDRLNQGQQGSCVAWSSGYAARTILEARRSGENPNTVAFSPSFLYNQIGLEGCQGSYIIRAMELMKDKGSVPFSDFPYDDQDCSRQPGNSLLNKAQNFTMTGFNRLTVGGDDYKIDLNAMRQNLAQGAPVVIGMMVGGSFMQGMMGKDVWIPTADDYNMSGFGGHAMCIIGYDDNLLGEGGFQIMNSWGAEWGKNGTAFVRYKDFEYFAKESYGVYPMGAVNQPVSDRFAMSIGLMDNKSKQYIALKSDGDNVFSTSSAIAKGTRFKLEVSNSIECYTYIFGQETDGSSYVLFPYTPKHSPYCGITGTRLFPKDHSLTVDDKGNKDFMAIVVTKQPINYNDLNKAINGSKQTSYQGKVNEALAGSAIRNVQFTSGNNISFDTPASNNGSAVAVVIAVNK